jgi:hypothetical protein
MRPAMTNSTIYRGYDIKPHPKGGFYWIDERGFDHTGNLANSASPMEFWYGCFATDEAAMNDIDAYKRAIAQGVS